MHLAPQRIWSHAQWVPCIPVHDIAPRPIILIKLVGGTEDLRAEYRLLWFLQGLRLESGEPWPKAYVQAFPCTSVVGCTHRQHLPCVWYPHAYWVSKWMDKWNKRWGTGFDYNNQVQILTAILSWETLSKLCNLFDFLLSHIKVGIAVIIFQACCEVLLQKQ